MKDDNDNRNDLTVGGLPMKRRHFLGLLTGGIAATAMGAPLSLLARANANGILAVAVNANPSSLDPATGGAGSDHTMLYPLFDTLVSWDSPRWKRDLDSPNPGVSRTPRRWC